MAEATKDHSRTLAPTEAQMDRSPALRGKPKGKSLEKGGTVLRDAQLIREGLGDLVQDNVSLRKSAEMETILKSSATSSFPLNSF